MQINFERHLRSRGCSHFCSIVYTNCKFFFNSTMHRAVCDISHSRNHPTFAAVIAFPPSLSFCSGYFSIGDSSVTPLRVLFAIIPSERHPLAPCCYLTFRPSPFSLAIPFLRCWTITLSRKAVAAITSAPKLLRHLGTSLVLLRRNGNRRGGRERRKAGEVKGKRQRKGDRGERRESG